MNYMHLKDHKIFDCNDTEDSLKIEFTVFNSIYSSLNNHTTLVLKGN